MDVANSSASQARTASPLVALLAAGQGGQGDMLREGLANLGFRVEPVALEKALKGQWPAGAQVLLVELCDASDAVLDQLDALMDQTSLPVLFHEEALAGKSESWMRKLADKLKGMAVAADELPAAPRPAAVQPALPAEGPMVWVLGASFGGPEATKRFLDAMPEVPDAIFFLAQHIGDGFVDLLAAQLNRSTPFRVVPARDGAELESGTVFVTPVQGAIQIVDGSRIRVQDDHAPRVYRPWIDGIMQEVARCFGPRAGAIVFSGMGDDGALGAQAIAAAGGEVWAQDSDSCSISSMPDCAAATGAVRRRGTPEELSGALVQYLKAREESRATS
ncbi:MAG: chemotaxis protein CheB [Ectothiorhodospiraceae bacterium]|nr:chemotaxis protein CheB [Ectothiorhodospiraceae bacterium]MCH8502739.1 chemotaxis protein CheB [Ectothiorhodospiraceae bacterium]